jgi:hypothetical protein
MLQSDMLEQDSKWRKGRDGYEREDKGYGATNTLLNAGHATSVWSHEINRTQTIHAEKGTTRWRCNFIWVWTV